VPVRVVVAPDKFKGSLTAPEVAAALTRGLLASCPDAEVVTLPLADGGEGTVDVALAAGWNPVEVDATGPTGEPVRATYAAQAHNALVELADVAGLRRLPRTGPDPLGASTYGLGTVMLRAVERGARRILLGVGGSASTDGGAGMLQAFGIRLMDEAGVELRPGGGRLRGLASIDLSGLDRRLLEVETVIVSDVDNPLLGPSGAATVYGPQKGASPAEVRQLAAGLTRLAQLVAQETGRDCADAPGAGAAGGTAFGAMAVLGARLEPGIGTLLDLVNFADVVRGAGLVVTGEGSLDDQSLRGKVPVGVAQAASDHGVPVVAVTGRCSIGQDRLSAVGISAVYALSDVESDPARSIAQAAPLLERLASRVGKEWLQP
jgi:glycerate 2-kinase